MSSCITLRHVCACECRWKINQLSLWSSSSLGSSWPCIFTSAAAPCQPVLVLMGDDESTGGCEKSEQLPLPGLLWTPCLWFPISRGVEVCSLAAGHSGSVFTKLCLFPGLQGSLGKPGSRGETNKKAPLSHTPELLLQHIHLSSSTGLYFSSSERDTKRKLESVICRT